MDDTLKIHEYILSGREIFDTDKNTDVPFDQKITCYEAFFIISSYPEDEKESSPQPLYRTSTTPLLQ